MAGGDGSRSVSGCGLCEYIGEEGGVKRVFQREWRVDIWRGSRFSAGFQICGRFFGHFYMVRCDGSGGVSRFGLRGCIGEEIGVKRVLQKGWHVDTWCPLGRVSRVFDWL